MAEVALSRAMLRPHVESFARDPYGVFAQGGADEFLREWDAGVRFPRGFVSLRGLVARVAMDEGFCPGSEINALMGEVFLPPADPT